MEKEDLKMYIVFIFLVCVCVFHIYLFCANICTNV